MIKVGGEMSNVVDLVFILNILRHLFWMGNIECVYQFDTVNVK